MNFIEINNIIEKGNKITRKNWQPTGSKLNGLIALYYDGIRYIPLRYEGVKVNFLHIIFSERRLFSR